MKRYVYVLLILLAKIANAQSTSTLMSARSGGIGYASSTLTDEWSLFNNVGGLGRVEQFNASFAYEARPALLGANRMAASFVAPTKIGALALGVFRFGDELYNEHLASLGFGNQIGNTSLGIKGNYVQYWAEGLGTTSALSLDFGGITEITPHLSIGAYITNLTQSKVKNQNGGYVPTKLTLGIGFRPSEKLFVATEVEKDLSYQPIWRTGMEYTIYRKGVFPNGFQS